MDRRVSKEFIKEFIEIRRYLHSIPEISYNEYKTSQFICKKLDEFGIEYQKGIGKTGIVAKIKAGESSRAIALRADIDALEIEEKNSFEYKSTHSGFMHACGHDGHTAMLLGAGKILNESKNFNGVVYLIFQPAEEGGGGAKAMIDDGVLEKYPFEKIYGLHNWPTKKFGKFYIKKGAIMASFDTFEIKIKGKSAHSSMPHIGINPIVVSAHIITAIKSISALDIPPTKNAVISVAKIEGGEALNIIPDSCTIAGSIRTYDREVQKEIRKRIFTISKSIAKSFETEAEVSYTFGYPQTINSDISTSLKVAKEIVGEDNIESDFESSFGSEDFSYFLQHKKGSYIWIGSQENNEVTPLHNSCFDFNDKILPLGVNYWIKLVEEELKK